MILLDGKKIKEKVREELREKFSKLKNKRKLIIIQVGDRSESSLYIKNKIKFGESIGVSTDLIKLPLEIDEESLIFLTNNLNDEESIGGIIVQLPLPEHINKQNVLDSIAIEKDIDGLSTNNQSLLYSGKKATPPATARAVIKILTEYGIDVSGKKVAVLGRSNLVGKPTAYLLEKMGADVSVCHRETPNVKEITKNADIIVSATGNPEMINSEYVKDGAVIVDVGIIVLGDGKYVGDVNFNDVKDKVSAISPVPGGVGAVTVSMIFENFYDLNSN